jgi:hypothetical protein
LPISGKSKVTATAPKLSAAPTSAGTCYVVAKYATTTDYNAAASVPEKYAIS